ncbi:DUF2971 domain-containing protein [Anaerobium acetethylicum]|nr:DUF2971 domain-containing protein [Anaerobium acetethylicum]
MINTINKPLYKYFENIDYALDVIENKQIHFENPAAYNDIFDCAMIWDKEKARTAMNTASNLLGRIFKYLEDEVIDYLKDINILASCTDDMNMGTISDIVAESLIEKYPHITSEWIIDKIHGGKDILVHAYNNLVSCFSENKYSLLMWGYYANNHTGACIEFKFDTILPEYRELVNALTKVNYTDGFIKEERGFDNYFTKSRQWEHEQEWRIACDTGGIEYVEFPFVSGIYLGCRMNDSDIAKFNKVGEKHNIPVFRAKPLTERYAITFK